MIKVVKRNGTSVDFDPEKIKIAISKANAEVSEEERMTPLQITALTADIVGDIQKEYHEAVTVEQIQDIVRAL